MFGGWAQTLKQSMKSDITVIRNIYKLKAGFSYFYFVSILYLFTLMMASVQVVETSVNTNNSSSQDYTTNPDDHSNHNIDSPGFKPFTYPLAYFLLSLHSTPSLQTQSALYTQSSRAVCSLRFTPTDTNWAICDHSRQLYSFISTNLSVHSRKYILYQGKHIHSGTLYPLKDIYN